MSKRMVRKTTLGLVVLLTAAVIDTKVDAIDNSNRYFAFGVGQRTCADYVRFREKKLEVLEQKYDHYTKEELYEVLDKVVEHWMAGFLTAHNLYVSDTYNVLGNVSMDQLKDRLESTCRVNSNQYFAEAMIIVVQQLNTQRVKRDPGK